VHFCCGHRSISFTTLSASPPCQIVLIITAASHPVKNNVRSGAGGQLADPGSVPPRPRRGWFLRALNHYDNSCGQPLRDRASVELPKAVFAAIEILGILRLRTHLQSSCSHCCGAWLRKTGVRSIGEGGHLGAYGFQRTEHRSNSLKRSWCDKNPRDPSTPRPSFNRAIAVVAALRSGRQGLEVLERAGSWLCYTSIAERRTGRSACCHKKSEEPVRQRVADFFVAAGRSGGKVVSCFVCSFR
jgi:hypothetical protein